jgi:broad specificity phosphatase PhoE
MEQNILKGKARSMLNHNTIIYIMRHGRTEWNAQGKLQGRLNSSLLPESIGNLCSIGRRLCGFGISAIYSSPLERCCQSADIISEIIGLPVIYMDDLVECNHGKCEGLSLDEAKNIFPDFFSRREAGDKWNIKWPGGESYADVAIRARRTVKKMDLERPALIIAHETVNKVLAGLFLGLSHDEIMQKKQKNSEIFRIDRVEMALEIIDCQL